MSSDTTAVALRQQQALDVNSEEAASFAAQLLKYARSGGALFPKDLSDSQATILARIAIAYGLDPIAGEVIPFQGRAYITIEGRTRKAQEHPAYDGLECVPATEDERKAFRAQDDEHLWVARVWRKDRRFPFIGYGRAAGKADSNPVSKTWGQEMAQKRAKSRALRDAFSMPLPDFEENQPDRPPVEYVRTYEEEHRGAVIEGQAREIRADEETGELPPDSEGQITPSQVTKIHTLVSVMKMDEDEYRDLLRQTFGVDSSLELSEGQAAAFSECLESVLANAQEEGRAARVDEIVEHMRESATRFRGITDDDDPSWQRTKQRDAERKAALEQAGFEPSTAEGHETAANIIEHEAEPTTTPVEKSRTRIQAEKNYAGLCAAAARLDIDLAPYEIQADCSDQRLTDLTGKLAAAVRVKTEQQPVKA